MQLKMLILILKKHFYGNATKLNWPKNYFDLVILNTFHNLHNYDLHKALMKWIELEKINI